MLVPPLVSIRFFEATARLLSVKLAAEELHVTPGAVTQQVHKLEAFLGQALFERRRRGLTLTKVGCEYLAACQEALTLIGRATAKFSLNRRQVISLTCTSAFASQWLVPRLQNFMRSSREADVHVSTTNRAVDLARESFHFAVRHGLGNYPGLQSELLLADDLIAVCSPRLIAPRESATMADIRSARLLHDEHRGDWRLWCESAGIRHIDTSDGIVFIDSNAAIEAALAGTGFALVRRALVQSELSSHRLLVIEAPSLRAPLAYHLVYRNKALNDPVLRMFRDWLLAQASSSFR